MGDLEQVASESLALLEIGVGVFDAEGRLLTANPAFRQLRGYPDSLCSEGVSLLDLLRYNAERGDFGPGDHDLLARQRLADIESAEDRQIEREMADGQILGVRYRKTVSGRLVITFEDRTAERQAQKAQAASEERYALVADAAEEAIYEWIITEDRFFASPRLARLLGRDSGKSGRRDWQWEDLIHPEDQEHYRQTLDRHLSGALARWECEYRLKDAEGQWRWVSDHGTSVRDEEGQAQRMVAALRDITERVEKDAALAASEERHILVTQATSDGIYDWNVSQDELFVSDNLLQILKIDRADSSSRMWADLVHPEDMAAYRAQILDHFKGSLDAVDCEYRVLAKDSQYRWVHDRGVGMRNEEGRVIRLVGAVRDITELKQNREEVEAARRRFEEAIEAIASGFVLWDAEDRLVIANSRFRTYFTDLADMVVPGQKFSTIIEAGCRRGLFPQSGDDIASFIEKLQAVRQGTAGSLREQEMADGLWLQVSDHRTTDGGLVSIYTDISDLKSKQQEIEAQSAILELTLENMSQGISLVNKDLETVAFNQRFLDVMAFPPERFKRGFHMIEAFRFNAERGEYGDGDIDQQIAQRLQLAAQFQAHQFERARPDGRVIEIVGNPVEGGGMVTTYTDITERKRSEEALQAAIDEFNAVIENIDYGVVFTGPDLNCRIVNRAFHELWDIPASFTDQHPPMQALIEYNRDKGVYPVAAEDWDNWLAERMARIEAGNIPPSELKRADGKVYSYSCIALADGGRMLTYFDITSLKEHERDILQAKDAAETALFDLQKAQERLVQSEKMASLGQLTAGIAHEIKNPLNFVNNFAKLSNDLIDELAEILEAPIAALEEEDREDALDLFETVRSNLNKINDHGQRADSIVKNMLLHSRDGPSERQIVSINSLAEEALNLAYHGSRAENPNLNITIGRNLSQAAGEIDCYPQDLTRVFLNLFTNAIYAAHQRQLSGEDGFSPEISVTSQDQGDRVMIEVRDNGTGIPDALREEIFVPFFTTKPAGEGTGLGLSLSYDIITKQHEGEMAVESEINSFTVIRITLPRALTSEREH